MADKIEISRDFDGNPTTVKIKIKSKEYIAELRDDQISFNRSNVPSEVLDYLKLICPFTKSDRVAPETGVMVGSNGVVANATSNFYTVPRGKKMRLLNATLSTCRAAGGATPFGSFSFYDPSHNVDYHLMIQSWTYVGTDGMTDSITGYTGPDLPSGWIVRVYADASASVTYGFIGLELNK